MRLTRVNHMKPLNLFPYDSNFDFIRLRWISLSVAALLMLVAVAAMPLKGFNFALDFTGGISIELGFKQPAQVDEIRARLADAGYPDAQVQTFGTGREVLVRMQVEDKRPVDGANVVSVPQRVREAASTPENPATLVNSADISPQVGSELATNGMLALAFVIIGFLAYISLRFQGKFAYAAIITTLHDVVVVTGWFAITGHEFDLTVLAGILSVMGYSINDTIVVFDRVRENFRSMRGSPVEVLNKSINQTLSRTIITSFVAFLTVLALYLYGGGSLRGMAEAQMIGIILGTVSTIFIACPLLLLFGVTKQDLLPKARDEAELARRP